MTLGERETGTVWDRAVTAKEFIRRGDGEDVAWLWSQVAQYGLMATVMYRWDVQPGVDPCAWEAA